MYRCNLRGQDITHEECWVCWIKKMKSKYQTRKLCIDYNAEKINIINNQKKEVESGTSVSKTNS